ncbi:MAG: zinc ribbon domain-containing protein [Candidatus Helarchaeota archaeon]
MSEEKEREARIQALIEGKVPVELAKGKLIVLIGSWVLFIFIGVLALLDLLGPQATLIATIFSATLYGVYAYIVPCIILFVIATAAIVGTVWLMIYLLRRHGYSLLKFSIIFFVILEWVIFFVALVFFGWQTQLIFLLLTAAVGTILAVLYFTVWKMRLELAGGILTITGQVTKEEKELLVPGYLKVIFIGILSMFGTIIGIDLFIHMVPPTGEIFWWHYVVTICYFFLLFLYLYINTYFFNAITTAITYIWYRKKDPTFHDGVAIATYQLPDIAVFAAFSAIIRVIRMVLQSLAKKSGTKPSWTGGGFRLADGIIGTVWYYVNYFTLPSIVIEDVKATTAIKRSAHRLFDNWVDVLLKEWGISSVFNLLQFLIIILFAGAGALFGALISWIYGLDLVVLIIVGVILFLFMSTLVSKPFLNLLNDVYLTFLFGFVIDKESNFKYENNLPAELNEKLREWFAAHPAVRRCQKCFAKVPEGATSCPKCGAPYP